MAKRSIAISIRVKIRKWCLVRFLKVTAEWRDEFYRRLRARGVEIDRELYDAAGRYVDRLIEDRVARLAFGGAEAKRRGIHEDAPLQKALELLRSGASQKELIARVSRAGAAE